MSSENEEIIRRAWRTPQRTDLTSSRRPSIRLRRQTSRCTSKAQQSSPDILFYCAYLNDSVGLIRAIAESEMNPLLVGGAMIGPQSSAVQTQLGSVINGIVDYEYWLPVPAMSFPGVQDLITDYQRRAKGTPADKLGYTVGAVRVRAGPSVGTGGRGDRRAERRRTRGLCPRGDLLHRRR